MAEPAVLAVRPKRRSFPGRPDQVAVARDFIRRTLGSVPVADEAVLLVSELATNALQHTATGAGGTFDVTVVVRDGSALIAVTDNGAERKPLAVSVGPEAEAGRGLDLVDIIADRWGHSGGRHGRTVWFELCWRAERPTPPTKPRACTVS